MLVTKQLSSAMGSLLVTNIGQFRNIIFCVQQKKELHTGLKYHEGEYIMTEFSL